MQLVLRAPCGPLGLRRCHLRYDPMDKVLGALEKQAVRLAVDVSTDPSAVWVGGVARDGGGAKGRRVQPRHVAILTAQRRRNIVRDVVKPALIRKARYGPQAVIPPPTAHPLALRGAARRLADASTHFVERRHTGQFDALQVESVVDEVDVAVRKTGDDAQQPEVERLSAREAVR